MRRAGAGRRPSVLRTVPKTTLSITVTGGRTTIILVHLPCAFRNCGRGFWTWKSSLRKQADDSSLRHVIHPPVFTLPPASTTRSRRQWSRTHSPRPDNAADHLTTVMCTACASCLSLSLGRSLTDRGGGQTVSMFNTRDVDITTGQHQCDVRSTEARYTSRISHRFEAAHLHDVVVYFGSLPVAWFCA